MTFPFEGTRRTVTLRVPAVETRGEVTLLVVDEVSGGAIEGATVTHVMVLGN